MITAASQIVTWKNEGSGRAASRTQDQVGVCPAELNELIHEIRQPLGVIEALAYYLELTSSDEAACAHVKHIQAMVSQVSEILGRASELQNKQLREAIS